MIRGIAEDAFANISSIKFFECDNLAGLEHLPDFGRTIQSISVNACGPLKLRPRMFASNTSLYQLTLQNIGPTELPDHFLDGAFSLSTVDLSLNWIHVLPPDFFDYTHGSDSSIYAETH